MAEARQYSDSSEPFAASSLRRRTSCIYCGQRISGKLDEWLVYPPSDPAMTRRRRSSAHVACRDHLDLPGLDPDYRERL